MKKVLTRTDVANFFGVSPQTISNWADNNLIKRLTKSTYSGASVEKLAREFDDVADITYQIKKTREELIKLQNEMDICRAKKLLWHEELRMAEIFAKAYKVIASKQAESKTRSIDIVTSILTKEYSFQELAAKYGVTVNRISQLAEKSINHFAKNVNTYEEMFQVIANNKKELAEKDLLIESLQRKIKEQEEIMEKIGIKNGKCVHISERQYYIYNLLTIPLNKYYMSARTYNITSFYGINTIGDLIRHERKDLLKLRNFGAKCLSELDDILKELNLEWHTDVDAIVQQINAAKALEQNRE